MTVYAIACRVTMLIGRRVADSSKVIDGGTIIMAEQLAAPYPRSRTGERAIREAKGEALPIRQIAARVGVGVGTVHNVLKG